MSKYTRNPLTLTALILTVTVCIAVASSFAINARRDEVSLNLAGYLVREGKMISLDKSVIAKSGEQLHYTMTASNTGEAVNQFQAVGQIPAGTTLIRESIQENVKVEFSIDGGKSFSAKPQIEIFENGQKRLINAPVEAYNAVAFTLADGFKGVQALNYEVKVK